MRKVFFQILILLVIGGSLTGTHAFAAYAPESQPPSQPITAFSNPSPHWVHTLEGARAGFDASLSHHTFRFRMRDLFSWLGWAIAAVSIISLLSLHLRLRRHSRFMVRAGYPDHFLIPPTANRRTRRP